MMLKNHIKLARESLRSSRWRSFLTILGVTIGVVAVVSIISIGEGIKRQIQADVTVRGPDVVVVLPGNQLERAEDGSIESFNPFRAVGFSLSESDVELIRSLNGVTDAVSFVRLPGVPQVDDVRTENIVVVATEGNVPLVLNQEVRFGTFFSINEQPSSRRFAVIGSHAAESLFGEPAPTGKSFQVGNQTYTVRGVFREFQTNAPELVSPNYNNTIFVSLQENRGATSGETQIYQVLVQPADGVDSADLALAIDQALLNRREGTRDFTVLDRGEQSLAYQSLLTDVTIALAAIAAIALFVAGIGIMNIMFVSVSERTAEIGVRKAIGATNGQILAQFVIEAVVLSLSGGIFGVLAALAVNYLLRISTALQPVILPEVMLGAVAVSFVVGVVFGAVPAFRAAHKNPIDALRFRQ
jgi:putative ABC transport system permease protein